MLIKFDVTQEDIDKGIKRNGSSCMIARCMRRTLNSKTVYINRRDVIIYSKDGLTYTAPHEQKVKIDGYDDGFTVRPYFFFHDICDGMLEAIGYFEQKGTTTPEDYINKESSQQQRRSEIPKYEHI